jgi:microcystin-dependent protein
MADPFVAEIRIFPFSFAPRGWAFCDGQLLPISQNTALFALLGTTYGGDGRSTFALPNLQGRAPVHSGQGVGLSPHQLGETGGRETVALSESEIPAHSHTMLAQSGAANSRIPTGRTLAHPARGMTYASPSPNIAPLANDALAPAGARAAHNNMMPYLTLYFCIALQGVFPSRT